MGVGLVVIAVALVVVMLIVVMDAVMTAVVIVGRWGCGSDSGGGGYL
jgi:hypothetical protein